MEIATEEELKAMEKAMETKRAIVRAFWTKVRWDSLSSREEGDDYEEKVFSLWSSVNQVPDLWQGVRFYMHYGYYSIT